MLSEWDASVEAFEGFKYKVKDCMYKPIVGITGKWGNYYLNQKRTIEGMVKVAKLSEAKIQKLPSPLGSKSLSKDEVAKKQYRAIIGMLNLFVWHT